ncbi:hypothetical protein [Meiothermus sp. CFH 77666]|uniref:hypothetical protein n=1 Tax=Meiothermus sp. CFH 77666 TaxID=2817942 RepID=UPI001AA01704|nr:hypothetical protein [Meiothermus sp. CFH 77666]MBO1436077.1 hypothetical protein [Meiothermus sp. CFH 77666]
MPKGEHLHRVRPSKEKRLAALGWQPLEAGEVSLHIRVRANKAVIDRFAALSAKERGRVVELGLEALEVEHAQADQ